MERTVIRFDPNVQSFCSNTKSKAGGHGGVRNFCESKPTRQMNPRFREEARHLMRSRLTDHIPNKADQEKVAALPPPLSCSSHFRSHLRLRLFLRFVLEPGDAEADFQNRIPSGENLN